MLFGSYLFSPYLQSIWFVIKKLPQGELCNTLEEP